MKHTKQALPGDSDQAAAFTLADIAAPDGSYPPDRVHSDYEARLAEAGVANDSGFLLRSLTRRYVLLETLFMQLVRDSGSATNANAKNIIYRNVSRLNTDMNNTLGLIHRIRLAQQEDLAPFLTGEDQGLIDDARADQYRLKHNMTTLDMVRAEARADDIYEAEFEADDDERIG